MFPVQDYYLEIDLYVWLAYASTVLCSSRQVMRTALCRAELRFYSATEATVAVAQRHTPYATLTAAQQARRVHRGEQPYCCSVQAPFPPAACLPACCLPACLHVCLFAYLPAPASLPRRVTSRSSALQCLSVARGTTPARLPSYQSVSQTAIACASSTSMQSVSMLRLPTDCFVLASSSKPLPRTHTPHLALKSHPSFFFSLFFFSSSPLLFSHQ